jgi:phage shock protein PspC (stress-responsive transcriptional regulator)
MTTMSDSGSPSYAGQPHYSAPRVLRRSGTDRVISGVSGGLGQYFGVDPVIFRVLFAVLSFFGGVGLLAYGLAWVLIPEPDVDRSLLDKALNWLRVHKVPPWLVIVGGAVAVWLGWFSWWAPGTLPALLLLAAVALVLARKLRHRPLPAAQPPAWPAPGWVPPAGVSADPLAGAAYPPPTGLAADPPPADQPTSAIDFPTTDSTPTSLLWPTDPATPVDRPGLDQTAPLPTLGQPAGEGLPGADVGWQPPPASPPSFGQEPLIPPLSDTRRSMQAWLSEAGEAHRARIRRRRPIKVAVGLALLVGWGLVAMFDALFRVPFPVYLWVGLGILGLGLLISIIARRMMLSLLIPILLLVIIAIGLGGTRASLSDGSGRLGWQPSSQSDLSAHYRQFAGQSTLDLTQLGTLNSPTSVTITQAAGEVVLRLPSTLNATVIADVHLGDIQNGQSRAAGQLQAGVNAHLRLGPPATATGQPLTIHVSLTAGHVAVERVN